MQSNRWERIEALFHRAMELAPENRASFLDSACGEDRTLRDEVDSLLVHHGTADDFIESPMRQVAAEVIAQLQPVSPGQRIGNFKILRKLAHGGMGTIYLAIRDDDQFKKEVAIKVVNRGMDNELVLRRFRTERQILANLEHPYIGRLLDGGTTEEGLPYFVMEYVEGQPIDEFCDERGLITAERLALFLKVCSAVQFAHQNLVVHRDIKPSNILVMADGVPKLLDFGIAKLLNPDPSSGDDKATLTLHQLMTPEYASPEQIRNEPITTASDVYSLGVLLYRLLTGRRPYRLMSRSPLEIQEAICKQAPDKPSAAISRVGPQNALNGEMVSDLTPELLSKRRDGSVDKLRKKLAGDIDYIVLKALRKEPHRRYSSVEQFSEDIRRHLEGRPVIARQGTLAYRSSKFVRRHKAWVAASTLFVITLGAGIVSTQIERAKAERRFDQVRKLANSFMFEVEGEINKGPTKARELLVKKALEYLDSLAQEAGNDRSLQRELATAYERVGGIQGNSYNSNLGDTRGALVSYRKSLELRQRLAKADPKNSAIRDELASSYEGLGDVLYSADDLNGGLKNYQRALALREPLAAANPGKTEYRHALAELYSRIGDIKGLDGYSNLGDTEGALQSYRQSVALDEQLCTANPDDRELQYGLAKTLTSIGTLLRVTGNFQEAVDVERRGVKMMEALIALDPANVEYQKELLGSYSFLRYVLSDNGEVGEAIHYDRKTLTLLEPMSAGDPQNTYLRRSLSVTYNSLGRDLLKLGDTKGSLEQHRKALAISEVLSAADPSSAEQWRDIAFELQRIGDAHAAAQETRQALDSYRKSLAISEKMLASNPTDALVHDDIAGSYAGIGNMLAVLGDIAGALDAFRKAVPHGEEIAAKSPRNIRFQGHLAQTYFEFGNVYSQRARALEGSTEERKSCWLEAKSQYRRSLDIWIDMQNRGTLSPVDAGRSAEVRRALARTDAAVARSH
jgi:serine/threonine protein kinase